MWLLASGRPLDVDCKGKHFFEGSSNFFEGSSKSSPIEIAQKQSPSSKKFLMAYKDDAAKCVKEVREELKLKGRAPSIPFCPLH